MTQTAAIWLVIVAALVGAGGLGIEAVYGLTKSEIGRGLAGGLSIVLLAVVLVTAAVDPSRRAAELGLSQWLSKPFELEQIRMTAARAIQHKKLRDEVVRLAASYPDPAESAE